jgi:D-sedoheptulose 7-phosphate isomerase
VDGINKKENIEKIFESSINVIQDSKNLTNEIISASDSIIKSIRIGGKLIIFGNGGSAADAQHIAGELIGRFQKNRRSYPAIALTTDSSIITAVSNDFSYETIFSRQCEALVSKEDTVLGISTSGNSKNVIEGIKAAKEKGAITIGLLGNGGGRIKEIVDISIVVKSESTPRIQEVHRIIYHIICQMVEDNLEEEK